MIRLGTIVLGAEDVSRAVAFWQAATGYDVVPFPDSPNQFTILRPPSGEGTRLAVQRSGTPAQIAPRVHLDFVVDTAAEQEAEIARLCSLGATRAPWDYEEDADFVVLADPENNRFCIVNAAPRP